MISIKDMINSYGNLEIFEQRCISDEYAEIIFLKKDVDKWTEVLADLLGSAVKPAGVKPTEEDLQFTEHHGGIRINQTQYRKDFNGVTVIAMLWPWQDDVHITLKMILFKSRIPKRKETANFSWLSSKIRKWKSFFYRY